MGYFITVTHSQCASVALAGHTEALHPEWQMTHRTFSLKEHASPLQASPSHDPQPVNKRMFFSLFHMEPHLLSLHFLSSDTALPRMGPSGRPVSFRGNSNRTHKGVIGPVPYSQRKDPTFGHKHISQALSSLPFQILAQMQVTPRSTCPQALLSTTAQTHFTKKNTKPQRKHKAQKRPDYIQTWRDTSFFNDYLFLSLLFLEPPEYGAPWRPQLNTECWWSNLVYLGKLEVSRDEKEREAQSATLRQGIYTYRSLD